MKTGGAQVHNGAQWYYSPGRSMGFAPTGVPVVRNTCHDVMDAASETRMCWHTDNDHAVAGYRCGEAYGLDEVERAVWTHFRRTWLGVATSKGIDCLIWSPFLRSVWSCERVKLPIALRGFGFEFRPGYKYGLAVAGGKKVWLIWGLHRPGSAGVSETKCIFGSG